MLDFRGETVQAGSHWALDQVCGRDSGGKATKVSRRQDDLVNLGMDIRGE